MEAGGTWLCPTAFDRERLLDMEPRIAQARRFMFAALAIGLGAAVPWFGWWILVLLAWGVLTYPLLRPWVARSRRPEYPIAAAVVNAQTVLGVAIALTGGPSSPAQPLLLFAIVTVSARFSARGVFAATGFTAVVLLGTTVATHPAAYVADPTLTNCSLVCLIGLAAGSYAVMHSDIRQRTGAILDPLTGLLNRKALMDRFAELSEQAALTGERIAIVVCDIDCFKAVNDAHGHERGDAVLREVAYAIRKSLRSFELVYRLGGEEFLIVLPGADDETASHVAERVRAAVEAGEPGGLNVTVSLGVACARGEVTFEPLFRDADEALYRAKREGRNRVATSSDDADVPAVDLVHVT